MVKLLMMSNFTFGYNVFNFIKQWIYLLWRVFKFLSLSKSSAKKNSFGITLLHLDTELDIVWVMETNVCAQFRLFTTFSDVVCCKCVDIRLNMGLNVLTTSLLARQTTSKVAYPLNVLIMLYNNSVSFYLTISCVHILTHRQQTNIVVIRLFCLKCLHFI